MLAQPQDAWNEVSGAVFDSCSADIRSSIPLIDDTKGDKQNNHRSPHRGSAGNLFGSAARRNKNELPCQKALAGQSLRRNGQDLNGQLPFECDSSFL